VLVERFAAANAEHEPPPRWTAAVAAAWARTAGWIRIVGEITAVAMCSDVTSEGAPMTSHTNGLWPCSSFQG
jgi:hypothetical protein